jgi:hypothetical protein
MRIKHTLPGRPIRARIPVMLTIAVAVCAAVLLAVAPLSFAAGAPPAARDTRGHAELAPRIPSFVHRTRASITCMRRCGTATPIFTVSRLERPHGFGFAAAPNFTGARP